MRIPGTLSPVTALAFLFAKLIHTFCFIFASISTHSFSRYDADISCRGKGYPYSVANCPAYAHNINNIPLNPANSTTYTMVQDVISQLTSTFSDGYVHLGGDEVVYGCWLQDPSVQRYMKEHRIASANDLMKEFISRVQAFTTQKQRGTVYWEEVFLSGASLRPTDIIQVWKDEATLLSVAKANVYGLLSYGWYLGN